MSDGQASAFCDYSLTKVIIGDDPDIPNVGASVEFRLTYEGPLYGATQRNTRAPHKHEIRKALHPQLRRLWETHPKLAGWQLDGPGVAPRPRRDALGERFSLGNYHFVPLICRDMRVTCGLEVLFLRPDAPGAVIQSGDLDNRIKTIFDAILTPNETGRLGGYDSPDADEDPFFTLVEDDSLVDRVAVEADMLLAPINGEYHNNSARVIIKVDIRPFVATWDNFGF